MELHNAGYGGLIELGSPRFVVTIVLRSWGGGEMDGNGGGVDVEMDGFSRFSFFWMFWTGVIFCIRNKIRLM